MFPRMLNAPLKTPKSFFLFGPRGTGKTTWLKDQLPQSLFINLLQAEFYTLLLANPSKLKDLIPPDNDDWIIIDEVQRIPALLNEVHHLIESKNYRFILTGSSARTLRRKGVNLLAGRALTYYMHPITVTEQESEFDIQQSLQFGHLPARFSEANPFKYLKDYVQTYLREEVMQESLTRNIAHFCRFLEVASFSQGETISVSDIAREAQIERSVADNYFSILEDLLIAMRLPVFSRKAKRKLMTQKKFYYFDVGIFKAIRPLGPLDSAAEIDRPALETLVLQELRAINDYQDYGYQIYYWRTKNNLEIDFVLYGPNGLLAIEVKRSSHIQYKETRALREFKKDYPPAQCYVFYGGPVTLYQEHLTLIPIEQALQEIPDLLSAKMTMSTE
ncbi:MAG: ATP-binding protein [Pseudomonadales bacterium]